MKVSKATSVWLFNHTRRQLPLVILIAVLSVLSALAYLWLAILSKELIEAAQTVFSVPDRTLWESFRQPALYKPTVTLIAVVIGQVILHVTQNRLKIHAAGRMEMQLRKQVFSSLLHAEYTALNDYHSGEFLTRLTSDVQVVSQGIITLLPTTASLISKLVGGLAVMAVLAPQLAMVIVGVGVIALIGSRFYGAQLKKLHKRCQESYGKTRAFMQDIFLQWSSVKAFAVEQSATEDLDKNQAEHFRWKLRRNSIQLVGSTGMYLLLTVAYYAVLVWCVFCLALGTMTVGTLTALLQVFEQLQAPMRNASGILPQYYAILASAERLQQIDDLPTEQTVAAPLSASSFRSLSVQDVTFAYDEERPVLDKVSFTVKRGSCTAIVGASGIGKSTLLKLILAMYPCQAGRIAIEGETAVEVNASTRSLMAYVPQGNSLIAGTIRENIAFFRDVTDERIAEVIRLACLDEFVASLPQGTNTPIGENGVGVSEGQAQRIAIARALLHDAPLLLLDECTSALDVATEQTLLTNLHSLTDKAVLLISHKDSTVAGSTTVLRLENGTLAPVMC